jgi:hypothetical protein
MGQFDCVIEQPNVRQHETVYSNIVFAPGDYVDVNGDGCVQTGGWGPTWKRYVNPSGPNADRLYHGLVRIPTGTPNSALVRISTVVGRHLQVTGVNVPLPNLVLHLGYEDDDYSDNGYNDHDDGTDDQCKTDVGKGFDGGPAYVTITIYRGVMPGDTQSLFDFDVLSHSPPDPNGLPYNPYWSWQLRPENQGKVPKTTMCHNFANRGSTFGVPDLFLSPSFADCSDQIDASSVDERPDSLCHFGTLLDSENSFGGHVNWFPITVEGTARWGDHSSIAAQIFGDDDYTFSFYSDAPGNPLSVNDRDSLHVEFDSSETIDHFTTDEWKAFHQAVDDDNKDQAKKLFDGHTILTGMFGLDAEHELKAELHPLYAMATRRDNLENSATDEVWLIFVRNLGDEGFCSSGLWSAEFEDYTFRLPWRTGATVTVDWSKTQFDGTEGTSGPIVRAIPPPSEDAGVYVSFHLGPVASNPLINGTLHLQWETPQFVVSLPVDRRQPGTEREEDEIEHKLSAAVHRLPLAQQREIEGARASIAVPRPAMHRLPPGGAVRLISEPPAIPRLAQRRHAVSAGPASLKLQRDAAMMRALCAATNNAPAGLPTNSCGTVRDHR